MSDPKPRTDLAVEFLQRWEPEGPWILTAIDPDKKAIATRTFTAATIGPMADWIEDFNGTRNLYFHVNPAVTELSKKAERTDIKSVSWLHVDIDPRAGEDIAQERVRALSLLDKFEPRPTVIVDSGGGYQGFWRLEDPIEINGDLNAAEDAKRYNIQLELVFGADNCHNIDRIMRLPGSVNIPDARKRKKGRVKALATLVEFNDGIHPTRLFTKAPEVQSSHDSGFSADKVKISGNIRRLDSIDDLPETVGGQLKILICQGMNPDEPTKYASRSEALFGAVVGLVRAGVDDDTIYSVITDENFHIAHSVLDKKNYQKYAMRQIERAKEEAIHPKLRELNEKHAVVGDIGGKCRVISEVFDPAMKRHRISRQSFDDFRNRYMHIQIEMGLDPNGKPIRKKLGQWWLEHPLHRHFETMCFAPGQQIEGAYNLWKGYGCEAQPGDCSLFLQHIHDNICSGNEEYYDYVMGWMARAVQRPDTPGEVALVLRGRMGTGKSIFARTLGSLFGRHFLPVSDPKHLVGSFNSHLRDCVLLFGDEAFYAGDKKHESVLKTLITEPYITFEAKGVDAETGPNYTHIILASNSNWIVPAGGDERRYLVLDVGDAKMQDSSYFRALADQLNNGGREALLHHLLSMDITEYNVRQVPKTEALHEQKLLSLSAEDEWWYSKLQEGRLLTEDIEWTGTIEKEELFKDFYGYMQSLGAYRRASKTALTKFLERVNPPGWPVAKQKFVNKRVLGADGFHFDRRERPYFYEFPDVDTLRKHWDKHHGGESAWPELAGPDGQPEVTAKQGVPF